jgi:hypothetical protein
MVFVILILNNLRVLVLVPHKGVVVIFNALNAYTYKHDCEKEKNTVTYVVFKCAILDRSVLPQLTFLVVSELILL